MTLTPTLIFGRIRVVDKDGNFTPDALKKMQEYDTKLSRAIDLIGQIQATTKISGRTEGIGTTVGKLDSGGVVLAAGADFSRAYVNKNTDNITDATGSPLAGGKRGFVALDTNNRLANSFRANPVNVSSVPTSSTVLSNDGASTAIPVAASTNQFAPGTVSNNAGSVDPGSFGTVSVYHDDPTFVGGAVTYQFTASSPTQVAAEGRMVDGTITSVGGTPKTGGGNTGGTTTGGRGGRGYNTL